MRYKGRIKIERIRKVVNTFEFEIIIMNIT